MAADDSGEQLLMRFGIDLDPVRKASDAIRQILTSLNTLADQVKSNAGQATSASSVQINALKDAAQAATASALKGVEAEKLRSAALQEQTSELQKHAAVQRQVAQSTAEGLAAAKLKREQLQTEILEKRKSLAESKAETAEIQKQAAEIRKKRLEEAGERRARGEESEGEATLGHSKIMGRLFTSVTEGLTGEGLAGSIAGGVLAGEGIAGGITLAVEGLKHFVEKLKDVSIESGSIAKLESVFNALATQGGHNAVQMMNELQESTLGLVSRLTLLKSSTEAMRAPYNFTAEQVKQLSHDIVVLSEASGHTAEEGMKALMQAFAVGRPYLLGAATGVVSLRDVLRDLPTAVDPVTRSMLEWQRAEKMIHQQAEAIGSSLPESLENISTRLKVSMENLRLAFGAGLNESFGIGKLGHDSEALAGAFAKMEAEARTLGNSLGKAFQVMGTGLDFAARHVDLLVDAFRMLGAVLTVAALDRFLSLIISTSKAIKESEIVTMAWAAAQKLLNAVMAESTIISIGPAAAEAAEGLSAAATATQMLTGAFDAFMASSGPVGAVLIGLTGITYGLISANSTLSDVIEKQTGLVPTLTEKWKALDETFEDHPFLLPILSGTFDKDMMKHLADIVEKRKQQNKIMGEMQNNSSLSSPEAMDVWGRNAFGPAWDNQGIEDPQLEARNARARLQMKQSAAREQLTLTKQRIAAEQDLDQEAYSTGEESFKEHLDKMRDIAKQTRDASIAEAKINLAAQLADSAAELKAGMKTQVEYQAEVKKANSDFHTAQAQAETAYQTALTKANMEGIQDRRRAALSEIQMHAQIQEQRIHAQETIAQKNLQTGTISPKDFFRQRLEQIQHLADVQIEEADRTYEHSLHQEADLQKRADAINKSVSEGMNSIDVLVANQPQIQLQAIVRRFSPQQKALQEQFEALQQQPGLEDPDKMLGELQQNLGEQMQAYIGQLQQLTDEGQAYSETWWETYQRMEQVYQLQVRYNKELQNTSGLMQPISQAFTSLNNITDLWTSKFAKNFSSVISMGAKALGKASQRRAVLMGTENVHKSPEQAAFEAEAASTQATLGNVTSSAQTMGNSLSAVGQAALLARDYLVRLSSAPVPQILQTQSKELTAMIGGPSPSLIPGATVVHGTPTFTGLQTQSLELGETIPEERATPYEPGKSSAGDKVDAFVSKLDAAVGALTDFIGAVTHSRSAVAGAVGGGMSGFGAGSAIGGGLSKFGAFGKLLGQYGGAAGAGIGMVIGGITGAKNAAIANEVSSLNNTYSSIMRSFQQNTDNLNATIVQLKDLIEQAQVAEDNSKKGGSQFASLITQYSQELDSLTNQQSSMISQLETQLAIFDTPSGMQSFLNNLNDIIQQYDKFSGAARNARDLADANSWLTDSLSNFTTSLHSNFVSGEESAINDALSLNELLSERTELLTNLNDQIQSILEQGVLTRQQTTAQKKGQQIYSLESNASKQLSTIDQQISLEQYKVSVEQYIFNLATTKIGLETQLLALQESQSSQQLAAIQALQQLIDALQNGNYNYSTIQSILSALGYSGAAANIPTKPGSNPAGSSSSADMDTSAASAYASRGVLGYGGYRGTNL